MTELSVAAVRAVVAGGGLLTRMPSPLILLCSAGRDSATLLDLAVALHGPDGLVVVHIDHALRPESASEAQLVQSWGERTGVPVMVRRLDPPARQVMGNLQAWARDERRRVALGIAAELGAARVATAHTQSDLVEGLLFRLATQPGRRALLGMSARSHLDNADGVAGDGAGGGAGAGDGVALAPADGDGAGVELVRPMLELTRPQVLAYARARELRWREDPSNADPRFARARIRSAVVPVLRALNPQVEAAIVRTARELEAEQEALAAIVSAAIPAGPEGEIPVDALAALPRPVARLVLREVCERWHGAPCPRVLQHADALIDRALTSRDPFSLDIGDGLRVTVRQRVVRCEASAGPAAPRPSR